MSSVPWNRIGAPVCVLLGGTGRARVPASQPAVVPALLQLWPPTASRGTAARVPCNSAC